MNTPLGAGLAPNPRRPAGIRFNLDLPLLAGLLTLIAFGLFVLYSASGENVAQMQKQGIRLGVALSVMVLIAQLPPAVLQRWVPAVFFLTVLLLVAVKFFGVSSKGAQRWLNLGLVRFQPSELAKLAVPMMVAWYLARRPLPPQWPRLVSAAVLLLVPVLLIAQQPDLGTSILVASGGIFVVFLAGISWRLIGGAVVAAAAAAPVLWHLMKDYQRQRVLTFLNPESDPLGSGYHIIQSKIAIGSGGVYGKGWLNGTQSQLDFLPERHTDFIFAVLAEEHGLVGVLALLAINAFIIGRGLFIAAHAQDSFTRLLAGSLTLVYFVYVFVNIGMVSGLLPVVGVPLPLVSYGGTSLVTLMAGFGILMSIHSHRKFIA